MFTSASVASRLRHWISSTFSLFILGALLSVSIPRTPRLAASVQEFPAQFARVAADITREDKARSEPTDESASSPLAAIMMPEGRRNTQLDEVATGTNEFTLTLHAISEHTIANGFTKDIFYNADSVGILYVQATTNLTSEVPPINLFMIDLPTVTNTFSFFAFAVADQVTPISAYSRMVTSDGFPVQASGTGEVTFSISNTFAGVCSYHQAPDITPAHYSDELNSMTVPSNLDSSTITNLGAKPSVIKATAEFGSDAPLKLASWTLTKRHSYARQCRDVERYHSLPGLYGVIGRACRIARQDVSPGSTTSLPGCAEPILV